MGKTVQHSATFRASPERLFEVYVDSKAYLAR